MGYRGKLAERQQARQLRRTGLPLAEIAARLGVSKSSVSLWVRDVEFDPPPPRGRRRAPNALQRRAGRDRPAGRGGPGRIGRLSEREFLVAGVALYAGEGSKRDGAVSSPTPILGWSRSSVPGSGGSSRSTRHGYECGSTCTKGSIWPLRSPSGRR